MGRIRAPARERGHSPREPVSSPRRPHNEELIQITPRSVPTSIAVLAVLAGGSVAPASGQAQAGGAFPSERPRATGVTCAMSCAGLESVTGGSVVRITGEALDEVAVVAFLGGSGTGDDTLAFAADPRPGEVLAQVPAGAVSGPVAVATADGNASRPTRQSVRVVPGSAFAASAGGVEARLESTRVYFAGRRSAQLSYFLQSVSPAVVSAEVIRARDSRPIVSFPAASVAGRAVHTVTWNGRVRGRVPSDGRYIFRIRVAGGDPGPGRASAAQADGTLLLERPFTFLRHRFPVRGKHSYGEHAATFGASRGGRAHQGHDVFARCGTPLVAARGGIVKFAGRQSRAGNYIVIDADGTGQDHAYMHLREKVRFEKGDRVYTGQRIGSVGDTGVASGCHLHFEIWRSPGWYTGGRPIDPYPALRRWDAQG